MSAHSVLSPEPGALAGLSVGLGTLRRVGKGGSSCGTVAPVALFAAAVAAAVLYNLAHP